MPLAQTSKEGLFKNLLILILLISNIGLVLFIILKEEKRYNHSPEVRMLPALAPVDKEGKTPYHYNQVKNTITKKNIEIRTCYNSFLESKPELVSGRLIVDWQVNPDGSVKNAELVRSQINSPKLASCLISKINSWSFPPPPSGRATYVAHTFLFKTQEEVKGVKQRQAEMEAKFNPLYQKKGQN